MRCIVHQDRESVGVCKSCGKGLCPECAVDLGKGLACRGRCEEDVRALITLVERNIQLAPATSRLIASGARARYGAAFFYLFMGLVFVAWGLRDAERSGLTLVLGGGFVIYAIYAVVQARRFARDRQGT